MKFIIQCLRFSLFIITLLTILGACSPAPKPGASLPNPEGWKLIFSDEFDGTTLDTSKWNTCYPWVDPDGGCTNSGNNEMQWYQPDEVSVEEGNLRLRAQDRSVKTGFPYTSGMVTTHEKFVFQYGYVESRLKVPKGRGLWPALWMLPEEEKWPPEIDIHEILGHTIRTAHTTVHYTTDGTNHLSQTGSYLGPDFSADFHTFGLLWEPDWLTWYIDGVERFIVEREGVNIPTEPFYLLINLAVGGNWPGAPDENTEFPAYYLVDYIRVFENEAFMATVVAPTPTPSGGSNILHAAQIVAHDKDGNPTDTFETGMITWKAQVVNQDGRPVRGETIYMVIENEDGSFSERVFAWDKTDRFGWAAFSTSVDTSGSYILRIEEISSLSEYDPDADVQPVEITVR